MLEYLKELDVKLLLWVNGGHTSWLDSSMLFVTHRYSWIPLYVLIVAFILLKKKKECWIALICIVAGVICADLFASSFMKPLFQRLRPCHDPFVHSLLYRIKDTCGGKYGFISSHAANTFALSVFLFRWFGKEYPLTALFFFWAAVVSLSRVYLGVHYPSDIIAGALAGLLIGTISFYLFRFFVRKKILIKS